MAEIYKRELSGIEHFDKSILTLSSAGLGLSVTFLKDVIALERAIYLPMAYTSWMMFVLAIVSTLVSFLVSGKALDRQKKVAESFYREGNEDAFTAKNCYDVWTRRLNYISAASFVLALFLTPVFVILNLEIKAMATSKNAPHKSLEQKGAPVPSMQRPVSSPAPAPAPAPTSPPSGSK